MSTLPIIYRVPNAAPLTYEEGDNNFLTLTYNLSGSRVNITGSIVQIIGDATSTWVQIIRRLFTR